MQIPLRNIKDFYHAAKNSGFTLEVFIDAGFQSEEAEKKWKTRREKQVKDCEMVVPPYLSRMIGEMFQSVGVKVHYSTIDNDDVLAAYA